MYQPIKHLINPSGGLTYHYLAWRYRKNQWLPFLAMVELWLNRQWNPSSDELIIFGPSAGWSLPLSFLNRFNKIICVEPDALARSLFLRRFAPLSGRVEFLAEPDLMPWFAQPFASTVKFERLLDRCPNAAILFANVLGQVPLLLPSKVGEEEHSYALRQLVKALQGRVAASYHDLLSSSSEPLLKRPSVISSSEALKGAQAIAASFFPPESEVIDHETLELSYGRETSVCLWRIRPGANHIIGFVKI